MSLICCSRRRPADAAAIPMTWCNRAKTAGYTVLASTVAGAAIGASIGALDCYNRAVIHRNSTGKAVVPYQEKDRAIEFIEAVVQTPINPVRGVVAAADLVSGGLEAVFRDPAVGAYFGALAGTIAGAGIGTVIAISRLAKEILS